MEKNQAENNQAKYQPPTGSESEHEFSAPGARFRYRAVADWIVLRKREKPVAEMFFAAYLKAEEGAAHRPVTFVFNGGPGAASAYLHVGALGPRRVQFTDDGHLLPPPSHLVDNEESWLAFTDLVFIDPIGTGFSRTIDEQTGARQSPPTNPGGESGDREAKDNKEFYNLERDLDSLCEFIQKFLSRFGRWSSPVYIAGESYGGYRVGRLSRRLQSGFGVGLSGAILISPALELGLLEPSDYNVELWHDMFPSQVAAAVYHGKSRRFPARGALSEILPQAERFAGNDLARLLVQGDGMPEGERARILQEMAEQLGLSENFVTLNRGRILFTKFARELLRDERKVLGWYDASVTAADPYPDREIAEGPDPTLYGIERVFSHGINVQLRETLKLASERDYYLLSEEVFQSWTSSPKGYSNIAPGASDDLRYGISLNPHMKVYVCHGYYDLVTPYWASHRLVNLMHLTPEQRRQVRLREFPGGHMFYSWKSSRRDFFMEMSGFFGRGRGE